MEQPTYYHSVMLEREKCKGCTTCLKHCPTEAIRVYGGSAHIIKERCIDCGACIQRCPYHAKVAVTDPLSKILDYKIKVALPAPTLYGQFKGLKDIGRLLDALIAIGFDVTTLPTVRMSSHFVVVDVTPYLRSTSACTAA